MGNIMEVSVMLSMNYYVLYVLLLLLLLSLVESFVHVHCIHTLSILYLYCVHSIYRLQSVDIVNAL